MPNYIKKPQHDYIKPIKEIEDTRVENTININSGSLIAFTLTVGGTTTATKTIVENPRIITVCNKDVSNELLFSLKAASTTGGSDFEMFNRVPVPVGTTLILEGAEVSIISKSGEGYNLVFSISATTGTPSADILVKT